MWRVCFYFYYFVVATFVTRTVWSVDFVPHPFRVGSNTGIIYGLIEKEDDVEEKA